MPFKEFTFFPVAAIGRFRTDIAVKHMTQHMIPISIVVIFRFRPQLVQSFHYSQPGAK